MINALMSDETVSLDSASRSRGAEGNQPKQSAGKLLACFAVAMAVVAGLHVSDYLNRASFDSYVDVTGVGDRSLFADGDGDGHPDDLWREVCRFEGRVLYRQARTTKMHDDLDMVRVGRTDDGKYALYQPRLGDRRSREVEVEIVDDLPTYYLRTGDLSLEGRGRYLHIGTQKYPKP